VGDLYRNQPVCPAPAFLGCCDARHPEKAQHPAPESAPPLPRVCEQADHGEGGNGDARKAGRKLLGRVHWRSLGTVALISWRQGLLRGKRKSYLEMVNACGMDLGRRKILTFCNKGRGGAAAKAHVVVAKAL